MLELVDSLDLKSSERKLVWVRVPPRALARIRKFLIIIKILLKTINLNNNNRRPPKDIGFGFIGLFLAIIIIIFDVAKFVPSFLYIVPIFYFAGFLNCIFIKKYLSGVGWFLQGIAFLAGYYIYGRLGIFVGLFIAFVIITPIINHYEEKII